MKLETIQYRNGVWSSPFPAVDSESTVVFVFGAPKFVGEGTVFEALKAAYPKSVLVGCSSSGEIFGNQIYDDSLSVAIVQFRHSRIASTAIAIKDAAESFRVGEEIAKNLNRPDLCGIFVLSDGLRVNGSELVRGINSAVPPGTAVTGGLAGDGTRFQETWVLRDGVPATAHVTAVAFYGQHLKLGHGSKGGWDIFGPERVITKAEGNILYELDGKPALQIYKEYLGEKAAGLPATALLFPLQIRANRGDDKKLVRTILAVDEKKNAMVFAGDLPQGHLAQLMRANFDRLIDGAQHAAKVIPFEARNKNSGDTLALAISCVGRRLVLGERTDEEVEATLQTLPENTRQVGFYSYGEISPLVTGQSCELHNQTMTLTTISEDEAA